MDTGFSHQPVLLQETLQQLAPADGGIYVDGTLGGAGHALAILMASAPGGTLVGIDRDQAAVDAAGQKLKDYSHRTILVHDNFIHIASILRQLDIQAVDGILLDLGVSSYQIDTPQRGFSYRQEADLDMRMDQRQAVTAMDIVNGWPAEKLAAILAGYGQERYAKMIARAIVRRRQAQPIRTTQELSAIVAAAMPAKANKEKQHPARRTFQAIRIAVNDELEPLGQAITDCVACLKPGGRLCVITFHSLEDRIVKQTFRQLEKPCVCSPKAPQCVCGKIPQILIPIRSITAGDEEVTQNYRAHSARLRVAERLVF